MATGAALVDPRSLREMRDVEGVLYQWPQRRSHLQIGQTTLEVTRALGDAELDPVVLHEPEFRAVQRVGDTLFLLVGTDGFWQVAARRASKRHRVEAALANASTADAAREALKALLTRWRLDDNVTLAIVKLGP
jgi:serine/threonine protein phosphatase PrpC